MGLCASGAGAVVVAIEDSSTTRSHERFPAEHLHKAESKYFSAVILTYLHQKFLSSYSVNGDTCIDIRKYGVFMVDL